MTIDIRRDRDIYRKEGDWFSARWHFSFDDYRDPEYMGLGNLRVFNDDRLIPGAIWPLHPHRNIEGLTYVVEGSFRHQDDVGPGLRERLHDETALVVGARSLRRYLESMRCP